jgi:hypothetical protein
VSEPRRRPPEITPADPERAERVRRGREVLSGGSLAPPPDLLGYGDRAFFGEGFEFRYFLVLSALVLLGALLWFVWGFGVASPVFLLLALALLAGWFLL